MIEEIPLSEINQTENLEKSQSKPHANKMKKPERKISSFSDEQFKALDNQMKGIIAHFTFGSLQDRDLLEVNDLKTFYKGHTAESFDNEKAKFLDRIEKYNGENKRHEYERKFEQVGAMIFGQEWEALQELQQKTAELTHETTKNTLRGYTAEALDTFLSSERWQQLKPHFSTPDALLPKDLNIEQVQALFDAVADPNLMNFQEKRTTAFISKDIPGLGTLRPLGLGEAKTVYELITPEGKKLAIALRSALDGTKPYHLCTPDDPKLVLKKADIDKTHWEYSDLHTYAILPTNNESWVVQLQEHGGRDNSFKTMTFRDRTVASVLGLKSQAEKNMLKHLKANNMYLSDNGRKELKQDHYLFLNGPRKTPALIDIPVEK